MKVQGFLVFLFVVGTYAQSFQGTWTDAVGGSLHICTTGPTSIGGVYSELGTIEGETRVILGSFFVSGTWADSGFNEYANGGFNWTLSADGNSFSGIYWYEDQPCITFEWNANRISTDVPATDECRVPSSSSTVLGTWTSSTSDTINICLENGFYYASYSIGSSVGYSTGRTTSSNRVLQGTFFDSIAGQGIESFWLIDSDILIQTSWLSLIHPSQASFNENAHSSITWTRSSSSTQELSCTQQRSLAQIDWNGVFTDKGFGSGRLFTCLDDADTVTGVYSEMGWVDGTVDGSGLRLSGSFYDGGNRRSDHGSFTLTQSASGFKFSGSFTIPGVSTPQSWSETRRDITNFFSTECYGYDTSSLTLSGQWLMGPASTDVFDVCLSPDGAITGSYEYSNGVRGYVSGFYYQGGKTAQVEWFETATQGIQITRHTGDDLLTNSWWGFYDAGDFFFQICDDDEPNKQYAYHNIDSYSRVQTTTTSKRCNRNNDLFNAPDQQTPSTEVQSSNSNSEASALNVNTMLVLSMSALAFLIYSLF